MARGDLSSKEIRVFKHVLRNRGPDAIDVLADGFLFAQKQRRAHIRALEKISAMRYNGLEGEAKKAADIADRALAREARISSRCGKPAD